MTRDALTKRLAELNDAARKGEQQLLLLRGAALEIERLLKEYADSSEEEAANTAGEAGQGQEVAAPVAERQMRAI